MLGFSLRRLEVCRSLRALDDDEGVGVCGVVLQDVERALGADAEAVAVNGICFQLLRIGEGAGGASVCAGCRRCGFGGLGAGCCSQRGGCCENRDGMTLDAENFWLLLPGGNRHAALLAARGHRLWHGYDARGAILAKIGDYCYFARSGPAGQLCRVRTAAGNRAR